MKIADFPWGWVGTYDDNEIEVVSTRRDPPKVRLAVDEDKIESNLGAVTFNKRRADGRHEEYGYVMGRLTADKQEGALYVALRPRGEQSSREVLYIDPSGAHFKVPVFAPNLTGQGASLPRTIALRSRANNRLVCAEAQGYQALIANRDSIGAWEMFDVIVVE